MLRKSYSVPWKNTEGLFFYNLLQVKGKKPHKPSLDDDLSFCKCCWTLRLVWPLTRILGHGGRLIIFKWMEINCSVTESLFFEGGRLKLIQGLSYVQWNKWVCSCLSMYEVGMESGWGSGFSFAENWWHDLEQPCCLAVLISPLPVVLLAA